VGVDLNWKSTGAYTQLPPGMKTPPAYWKALTQPVPLPQGLPHFRNITVSDVTAIGARQAFRVRSRDDAPLENFKFKNVRIGAQTAGSIQDAVDWTFVATHVDTADGSRVTLKDCRGVRGLAPE
jgi:hypothetical protein